MFCPNCGKACSNVRFCPSCGTQLPRVEVHPRTATPQTPQATAQVRSAAPQASVPHAPAAEQCYAPFFEAWRHWSTKGRASRSEYWFGQLQLVALYLGVSIIATSLGSSYAKIVSDVVGLLCLCLNILWTVRRFHDTGRGAFGAVLVPVIFGVCRAFSGLFGLLFAGLGMSFGEGILFYLLCIGIGLGIVCLLWLIWVFVVCCLPSDRSPNRYGSVPFVE